MPETTTTAEWSTRSLPAELLERLPTPCVVIDVVACERNIRRAAELFRTTKVKLRPHFKAHKCIELMRRQLSAGACVGVTCATAAEAETLARHGFEDILVANQVVHRSGLAALARAARHARITVAVDDLAHVALLDGEADRWGVSLEVVIEIDVGMSRCGIEPGSDALHVIADAVAASDRLSLRGLQGYEGHTVLSPDREDRHEQVRRAGRILAGERDRLTDRGHPCSILSGGGTGTFDLVAEVGVLDEVQIGSYALMDATYARLGLPFENALYVLAHVISRPDPARLTLNAGLKAISAEYGMPEVLADGLSVTELSDEHALVTVTGPTALTVGEPVLLLPAHIDPTINLHDVMFAWDSSRGTLELWRVDGRRVEASEITGL